MITQAPTNYSGGLRPTARLRAPRSIAGLAAVLTASVTIPPAAATAGESKSYEMVAERYAVVRLTDDAPASVFLERARASITARRPVLANEALERAKTRLLDDRAAGLLTRSAAEDRAILDVDVARRALAAGDRARALYAIEDALTALTATARADPSRQAAPCEMGSAQPPAVTFVTPLPSRPPPPPPPPPPNATFVLLPGHWQLDGATYVWVKGDDALRPTAPRAFVQGRYVWRNRAWVWVPDHYE